MSDLRLLEKLGEGHIATCLHWIWVGGTWVRRFYYRVGSAVGWLLWVLMQVWNWISGRLWNSVRTTLIAFVHALHPYFDLAAFFHGMRDMVYAFWTDHRQSIVAGAFLFMAMILAVAWIDVVWSGEKVHPFYLDGLIGLSAGMCVALVTTEFSEL